MNNIFISIIIGTNRPENVLDLAKNIHETSSNPHAIEILFSVDEGDSKTVEAIEQVKELYNIKVKYLTGVRKRGYFSANHEYNKLLGMIDNNTYFIGNFSDKTRLKSKGWDDILRKHQHRFEDDVFRIKISYAKHFEYKSRIKCFPECENFAFLTKKYMELIGGWGDCWGPDSWLQLIEFDLDKLGYKRGVAVDEIELEPYLYSKGLDQKAQRFKICMIDYAFNFFPMDIFANLTARFLVTKISMYIDNYVKIKNGYHFEYKDNNTNIFLFDNAANLIDKRQVRLNLLYALRYQLTPNRRLYKLHIKEYKVQKKDGILKYYFYKTMGVVTLPYFRLVELFKIILASASKNIFTIDLNLRKFDNGLEVISNPYIENEIQKKYIRELENIKS